MSERTCPICGEAVTGSRATFCSMVCKNRSNHADRAAKAAADPAFRLLLLERKRADNANRRGTKVQPRVATFDCAWCGKTCTPGVDVPPHAAKFCCHAHKVLALRPVVSRWDRALRKLEQAQQGTMSRSPKDRAWRSGLCAVCGRPFVDYWRTRSVSCSTSCARIYKSEKVKEAKRRRRALKVNAVSEPYSFSEVVERDRGRCQLCGRKVSDKPVPHPDAPTLDHILPLSKGGDDTLANVQLAHFLCNSKKGDRVLHPEQLRLVS